MIEITVDVEPETVDVFILDDEGSAVNVEVDVDSEIVNIYIEVNE